MFKATGSMPVQPGEEKLDDIPAAEPAINEPSEDVPTPSKDSDDALADELGVPKDARGEGNPLPEGELDPSGPEPVVEPVKE